jgi:hypothetical protein
MQQNIDGIGQLLDPVLRSGLQHKENRHPRAVQLQVPMVLQRALRHVQESHPGVHM